MNHQLALVTGASTGLGRALALALAKQNIPLILTGRDREALEKVKRLIDVEAIIHSCDLASSKERQTLLAITRERSPDLIINNAGFGLYGDVLTHTTEEELSMLEVNCHALVEITLEAARALIANKKKGTILNISSTAAFLPCPKFTTYAASKAFVKQFSEGLDAEVKEQGVRVLVACPGQIQTDFRKRASRGHSSKPSKMSMPVEKAVKHIFYQIKKEKSVYIFDWRYYLLLLLLRILPQCVVQAFLKKEISSRIR